MPSTRSQAGADTPAGEAAEVAEEKEGDSEAEKEAQNREFVDPFAENDYHRESRPPQP